MQSEIDFISSGSTVNTWKSDYSTINRIMLRYRPIVPKPVGGEAASPTMKQGISRNGGGGASKNDERRTKRKYVRVRKSASKRKSPREDMKRSSPPERSVIIYGDSPPVTLQLLPERSESSDPNSCYTSTTPHEVDQEISWNNKIIIDHHHQNNNVDGGISTTKKVGGGTVALGGVMRRRRTTWIIVESVMDALVDQLGLGYSDEEKINNLQMDTCPGFVSDGRNNVVWVNDAYRKMVAAGDDEDAAGVTVWLVVKEKHGLAYKGRASFACRVRMIEQISCKDDDREIGRRRNRAVACDVWRMEHFSGFAWKLDLTTALGLSII